MTYAKFQVKILSVNYDFAGVEVPIFLLIFACASQQCSAILCCLRSVMKLHVL